MISSQKTEKAPISTVPQITAAKLQVNTITQEHLVEVRRTRRNKANATKNALMTKFSVKLVLYYKIQ